MKEVERLSISELCGQLLVIGYEGSEPDDALLDRIRNRSLGGVILFGRNVENPAQVLAACRSLHRAAPAGYPIFVAVDQEGGRVQRLKAPVLQLPPMRTLGTIDDPELTRRAAALLGTQLSALGFNLDFAPVADVDTNPKNPVIGDRSFGREPALVTRHVRAFAEGLEASGVIACLKHFPGHGDTAVDSHLALPVVEKATVELRRTELYPFERAATSAQAVMTAHVVFPAFDRAPATLSARLLGLLRREFAFDGVVFSDDLEMAALSAHWPIEESSILAIEAGCDVLLICRSRALVQRAHQALVVRAERDEDFRQRCERAAARSLALRQRFPQRPARSGAALQALLANPEAKELQLELLAHER